FPVDGHYCQGCALLRKKFKEDLFTSCIENGILQDSSKPSNDNTNLLMLLESHSCGDPLEYIFCHQCTCELCGNGAHYGYNCLSKVPIIPDPEPFNNQTIEKLPPPLPSFDPTCYPEDGNLFTCDSTSNLVHDSPNVFDPPPQPPFYFCEFYENDARYGHYCTPQVPFIYPEPCYNQDFNFSQDFHDFQQQDLCCENYEEEEKQIKEEQAANARYWKIPACYDDDDDDYTIAIIHKEPNNSLSMGDEHLDTIPETESDKFIKSSVENLVPNPNISKKIYLNPLFDEEIISMKIDPHHFNNESDLIKSLLNCDSLIISSSSKIDSLFDEFAGELTLLKLIPPRIDETDCDPEEETCFIKRLLYDNSSPRPPKEFVSENSDTAIESFFPSHIPVEDRILNVKMMGDISEQKVPMPRLMSTQPTFVLNQEKSPDLLSHLGHEAFQPSAKCQMIIYGKNTPILDVLFFHFYPP
nr:hypothetical protein [Tanacetum cinerariifolium]